MDATIPNGDAAADIGLAEWISLSRDAENSLVGGCVRVSGRGRECAVGLQDDLWRGQEMALSKK
jgi:hypothetical protein